MSGVGTVKVKDMSEDEKREYRGMKYQARNLRKSENEKEDTRLNWKEVKANSRKRKRKNNDHEYRLFRASEKREERAKAKELDVCA